jgi:acyl carrier protein
MDAKGLLRRYLADCAGSIGEVADGSSLLGQGIIDSAGVLELVAFVENAFRVRVGDSELIPENFDSLNAIQSYLERKLAISGG